MRGGGGQEKGARRVLSTRTRPGDCSRNSAAAMLKGGDKDTADRTGGKKTEMK